MEIYLQRIRVIRRILVELRLFGVLSLERDVAMEGATDITGLINATA